MPPPSAPDPRRATQAPAPKTGPPPLPPAASRPPGVSRPGDSFVLRFISGKYQGGEFPVVTEKQIMVGRSSELDMVLVEDMVSRKHARIAMQTDQIWIEDLGSTNGTFVNGEKIKRARLKEGDRILIGTSILKLVAGDATRDNMDAKRELENVASRRRTSQARTMSGSIEEVPLPDLLQLFGTSKKSGVLVIRTEDQDIGRIYLKKGNISYAIINDLDEVAPLKSVYRMLTWQKALFEFEPPVDCEFSNEVDMGVQEILMEGIRQLDELNRIHDELPDLHARLELAFPMGPPLRALAPSDLDILQIAHNATDVEAVMNKSALTDFETVQAVLKLLKANYLKLAEASR